MSGIGNTIGVLLCLAVAYGNVDYPMLAGGLPGNVGDFPYVVFVMSFRGNESSSCTGTILHEEWILTSGHCTQDFEEAVVYAGLKEYGKKETTMQVRNSSKIYTHPKFKNPWNIFITEDWLYDYGLIKLESSLDIDNKSIKTIELDDSYWEHGTARACNAVGFGQLPEDMMSKKLYFTEIKVSRGFGSCPCAFKKPKIHGSLCYTTRENKKSLCSGDAGGPLIYNGRQVGVASHFYSASMCDLFSIGHYMRFGCGVEGTVNVYTYIIPMLNWIRKYVGSTIPVQPNYCD